jgi:hypothetical protein
VPRPLESTGQIQAKPEPINIESSLKRNKSTLALAARRNLDSGRSINFNNRDVKIKRLTKSTTSLLRMRESKLKNEN